MSICPFYVWDNAGTFSSSITGKGKSWKYDAYDGGKFVAVADDSDKAAYSTDGITWKVLTLPCSQLWEGATFGDGKFIVMGAVGYVGSNKAAYSTGDVAWSASTLPSTDAVLIAAAHQPTNKGAMTPAMIDSPES